MTTDSLPTDLLFLGELLHVRRGIRSHRQQPRERSPTITLRPHLIYVQYHALCILVSQGVGDVAAGLGEGAVGAPGAH